MSGRSLRPCAHCGEALLDEHHRTRYHVRCRELRRSELRRTADERRDIYGDLRIVSKLLNELLNMFDALTAENERLREEKQADCMAYRDGVRAAQLAQQVAESRLAAANALLLTVYSQEYIDAHLAACAKKP